MGKPTLWFLNGSDTNRAVQTRKMVRDWKLYYPCSENKCADQLRSYCEADLRLSFAYADCLFSHAAAHILNMIRPRNFSEDLLVLWGKL